MQIHNALLNDTKLAKEDFQSNGYGSAFVTREDELVVLILEEGGVASLPDMVDQLVDRGFHSIVLDVTRLPSLDKAAITLFIKAKTTLENWDGRLAICGVGPQVMSLFESTGVVSEFQIYRDVAGAVESQNGQAPKSSAPSGVGLESEDIVNLASSDLLESSEDALQEDLTSSDQGLLDSAVLESAFDTFEDSQGLVEESQVDAPAPAPAPQGIPKSEFKALQSQLAKLKAELDLAKAQQVDVDLGAENARLAAELATSEQRCVTLDAELGQSRAAQADTSAEDENARLSEELSKLTGQTDSIRAELEEARSKAAALEESAQGTSARVTGLEAKLTDAEQALEQSSREQQDLRASLDQRAGAADAARDEAQARATEGEANAARAEGQLEELQRQLEGAREESRALREHEQRAEDLGHKSTDLEGQLSQERQNNARLEGRLEVLASELDQARRRSSELELRLETLDAKPGDSGAGPTEKAKLSDDVDVLQAMVVRAEEDKIRLLAEAQIEFERLNREQDALREELESAGDMIERLGKELELS